jgi:hypothetical protein
MSIQHVPMLFGISSHIITPFFLAASESLIISDFL